MFKNPKFSSTETSSFNTLYRQTWPYDSPAEGEKPYLYRQAYFVMHTFLVKYSIWFLHTIKPSYYQGTSVIQIYCHWFLYVILWPIIGCHWRHLVRSLINTIVDMFNLKWTSHYIPFLRLHFLYNIAVRNPFSQPKSKIAYF